jgi:hypothetical protein
MTFRQQINEIQWERVKQSLYQYGFAPLGRLLGDTHCRALITSYQRADTFRSRIDMSRYRFGKGEYKYFAYPLPEIVKELREHLYSGLAGIANTWMRDLGIPREFPPDSQEFIKHCHAQGQCRPTPILLRYKAGDFNCLHQDLYGEVFFPFQVICALSRPNEDYEGGELILVEQRPRAQSVGHVLRLKQGEAVVITTRYRPVRGSRGFYRANMRHGVSEIHSGERYTLGLIFHDAA